MRVQMHLQDRSCCPDVVCQELSPERIGHRWTEWLLTFTRAADVIRMPMNQAGRSASVLNSMASSLSVVRPPNRIKNCVIWKHKTSIHGNTAGVQTCYPICRRLQQTAQLSQPYICEQSREAQKPANMIKRLLLRDDGATVMFIPKAL